MKLTAKLKAHLIAKGWATAETSDEDLKKIAGEKMASDELTLDEINSLTKEAPTPAANLADQVKEEVGKQVKDAVTEALKPVLDQVKSLGEKKNDPPEKKDDPPAEPPEKKTEPEGSKDALLTGDQVSEIVKTEIEKALKASGATGDNRATPSSVLFRASEMDDHAHVSVKEVVEGYDSNRKSAIVPQRSAMGIPRHDAGQPVVYAGRALDMPSDRDKAISQAWFKLMAHQGGIGGHVPPGLKYTDHDDQLVKWAIHNSKFTGIMNVPGAPDGIGIDNRKLSELEVKTLLDDSTSGGLEIVPIEFDDAIILTPLLFGEFFPLVNVIPTARGRRMEGASMSNPTITSGTAEGTSIVEFDTDSFISAFDTTIFNAVGAMSIGEDFLQDSPTTIGQLIIQKYGEQMMAWLDEQIVKGDGTTEPQGIFNASGITDVAAANATTGPWTVGDMEGVMLGVTKAFRNARGSRNVFLSNETTYRRIRAIAVGSADQRRVFGMDHGGYRIFDHDFKVNSNIANAEAGFCNLGFYRMYRRMGMQVRIDNSGKTHALTNTRTIVVRARYGGKLELGGAFAKVDDGQT